MAIVEKCKDFLSSMEIEEVRCIVCGSKPLVVWFGEGNLFLCRRCALEIVPRLVGEAMAAVTRNWRQFKGLLQEVEKNIYRGALASTMNRKNVSHNGAGLRWEGGEVAAVRLFVSKCCELGEGYVTPKEDLYHAYERFADEIGLRRITPHKLTKILKALFRVEDGIRKIDGVTKRVWFGIRVKGGGVYVVHECPEEVDKDG